MSSRPASPQDVEGACWRELERAGTERGHPWRTMTLATADDGGADARVVVLREAQPAKQRLLFYTDARSAKVAQLRADPRAMLVAWSPALGWQLRLRAEVEVFDDGLEVSSRWATLQLSPAAQDYMSAQPPGTPTARPEPKRGSRAHFALMVATVASIDWLELHPDGHRRVRADADGARWITP